jgi:hypothetical protein
MDNPSGQRTRPGSESYDRDPYHDQRVISLVMRGAPDAEVWRMMREVTREYGAAARNGEGAGQRVTGPPRPGHWLTPSARAREELTQLGQTLVPRDRHMPHGSAVTVTSLGQAPEVRQCASGHELHPEASACGICLAGPADLSPDPPVPASRYPAELGMLGGR